MTIGKDSPSIPMTVFGDNGADDEAYIDSFTEIDPTEGYSNHLEDLKGKLGYHTVQVIDADKISNKLPEFEGTPPAQQTTMKYNCLRLLGRLVGTTRPKVNIFRHEIQGSCPSVRPSIAWDSGQDPRADIFVADRELADYFKSNQPVHIVPGGCRALFDGPPKYQDIQQNDKRGTCYLLSALASYASTPVGNASLTSYIHKSPDDGYAMVTLYDPVTEQDINVMVSTDRLTDQYGNDLYSCRSDTGAQWSGIVEKAVHALKISRANRLDTLIKEASDENLKDKVLYLQQKKRDIIGTREGKGASDNYLDHSLLFDTLSLLPGIPEISVQGTGYRQKSSGVQVIDQNQLKDAGVLAGIKFNVDHGIPVVLGTGSGARGILQAVTTGTPKDHAVAVLGPAAIQQGSAMPEGLLIYDPYGTALDGTVPEGTAIDYCTALDCAAVDGKNISETPESDADTAAPSRGGNSIESADDLEDFYPDDLIILDRPSMTQTKSAGQSVRFYRYDQLHQYFSQVAIARGGFIEKRANIDT